MSEAIYAWTDGAYSRRMNCGGWGVVLSFPDNRKFIELSGHEHNTTNNRMELMGAIMALESCPAGSEVVVTIDSQYVAYAYLRNWIQAWRSYRFVGRPNPDLWLRLDAAVRRHARVSWVWVRGHEDNEHHNRADALAVAARLALAEEMRAAGEEYDL